MQATTDKTLAQLVAEYNAIAATPVKSFKSKAEALERIAKLQPVKPKSRAKPDGVGSYCRALIALGKTNKEILERVREDFPDAATTATSISWYRCKMKAAGLI